MNLSQNVNHNLVQGLIEIDLKGIAGCLSDFLTRVKKEKPTLADTLLEMVRIEKDDRAKRSLERRMARSGIRRFKPMDKFDWNWPKEIDQAIIKRALSLRFIEEGVNIILIGAHGLGKTTIIKNIAYQAVLAGYAVLFTSAAKMINSLSDQDSPRALERRIKYFSSIRILAIDELGYLSYDSRAADLLFEVITRRHEARKPILISTNLAFKDWDTVFPNATSTVALIDRLIHHADIIKIEGSSYRKKEAQERIENMKNNEENA